jgi:hypothetical protein
MKKQQQKHPFGPLAWKWLGIQYPKSTFILLKLQKYGSAKMDVSVICTWSLYLMEFLLMNSFGNPF